MGNPLSPFLANLFMSSIATKIKADEVHAVTNIISIAEFLALITRKHPNIQFTVEEEVSGSIPFLNHRLTRIGSELEFYIYPKSTQYVDRYIIYDSFCPHSHKIMALYFLECRIMGLPQELMEMKTPMM